MGITLFISILYPNNKHQNYSFCLGIILGQNAGMYSDVCDTVSAMDTCAAQRFTWHQSMRGNYLAPPLIRTFATSFIKELFHETVMSYTGSGRLFYFSMIPHGASYHVGFTELMSAMTP